VESKSLVALDKTTGEEVWRVPGIERSWSTPLVVALPDDTHELVVSSHSKIRGIDPTTGKELWECAGVPDYVCPGVIAHEGIVYVTGGRKPYTFAIRAGGRRDVTDSHVVWELRETPKVATPLYHDGYLYWMNQRGVATCVDAKTGEVVYEERMDISGRGDKIYASVVLAGDKLYYVTRADGTIVLAIGPEFQDLARNHLGDSSIFNATPVPIPGGRLLIRSDRCLYCIGQ
jgi:outer membrane protein assembly factor BamB